MRLWSLHPKYLDKKGLVALWRESLLAKKVLQGKTKGYRNHPQLIRFKNYRNSLKAIDAYLYYIFLHSREKNCFFDKSKIAKVELKKIIKVTKGQLEFERKHLLGKLKERNPEKFKELKKINSLQIKANPLFKITGGGIENWEID